ncbi:hypothetical protein U1707_06015 [Sphingomonas sp. PB2P12]|uniref:hypothetical protein n=1 Tax=Sphingomonas sandaracina TaxID=3096157 RepID=UPI002FCC1D64
MAFHTKLTLIVMTVILAGCGPVTAVRNDTKASVYIDFVSQQVPRPPSPQKLASGDVYSGPWSPKQAGTLYLGGSPDHLRQFPVATLCNIEKRSCDLHVSQLPAFSGNGS